MHWWWDIPLRKLMPLAVLIGAYGVSAVGVMIFVKDEGRRSIVQALAITLSVLCLCLAFLMLRDIEVPQDLLLPALAAAILLLPLSVSTSSLRLVGLIVLSISLLGVGAMSSRAIKNNRTAGPSTSESTVRTAFYPLRMLSHLGVIPIPATRGGGLASIGDDVLLGTGDGHLYALTIGAKDELKAHELATLVPLNREEFAKAFGGSARAPIRSADYAEAGPAHVQTWRFRVADVMAQPLGDKVRVLASHHYWHADKQCFSVRVSQTELPLAGWADAAAQAEWRTLFESEPCIPMTGPYRKRGKNPFRGEEIGGRMALIDADTLLLTLGDHGFYGMESVQQFSQDPQADYGKTIRIDLKSGEHSIYTYGHRNPQGLYVAPDGRIWESEHAAQGGDEVNLLVAQTNYGWPLVTYGTEYGSYAWQLNPRQGRHEGYAPPQFAYLPSIGISALIGIERDRFENWRGSLVAGSLATRSLYRMVTEGNRIVLSEPIALNRRVRDVLELPDGRLLVWSDDAALTTIEPATGTDSAVLYATLCTGCHVAFDGMTHRLGPDLLGIVNRPVASAPGFDEYSPALQALGGTWTPERLDEFLRDPQSVAPGTTMGFPGLADDRQRADLVQYLATVKQSPRKQSSR